MPNPRDAKSTKSSKYHPYQYKPSVLAASIDHITPSDINETYQPQLSAEQDLTSIPLGLAFLYNTTSFHVTLNPTPPAVKLELDDVLYCAKVGIGLRNNSRTHGLAERVAGGHGDCYSLAIVFNPAEPLVDRDDDNEILFRKKVYAWQRECDREEIFTTKMLFPTSRLDKCFLAENAYQLLSDSKQCDKIPVNIKTAIVKQMKQNIIKIILNCLRFQKENGDYNVFHLISRGRDAQRPRDFTESKKELYPTGKCGSQSFDPSQVLATVEEGVYFLKKDHCNKNRLSITRTAANYVTAQQRHQGASLFRIGCHTKAANLPQLSVRQVNQVEMAEAKYIYKALVTEIKRLRKAAIV